MFDLTPFKKGLSKGDDFFDKIQSYFANDNIANFPQIFKGDLKVDLKESEKEYIVEAELPGVKKEDIEVTYEDNYLSISAKREESVDEKKENYIRKERSYGSIKRAFYVNDVEGDKISAVFSDGVLKLTLPKKPSAESKKIIIE